MVEMQVRKTITVVTLDGGRVKKLVSLFDMGARLTYIARSSADKLGFTRYRAPREIQLAVRGGKGKIVGEISLKFKISGQEMPLPIQTYVVDDLAEDLIIGTNLMEAFDVALDLKKGRAVLTRVPPEVRLI